MADKANDTKEAMKSVFPLFPRGIYILPVLSVTFLCLGCKPNRPSKAKDFSKTNVIVAVLGEKETEFGNGLQHAYWERDGLTTLAVVDGVPCRHMKVQFDPGYLYFIIDPTFKKRSVKKVNIEVEYYDHGFADLGVQFDASKFSKHSNPAYAYSNQRVKLSDSGMWRTTTFQIRNARFKNSQNSGSDFRVWVSPPEVYIRRVTVKRAN